jgi:type VI secretion system protein ImpM
VPETLTSAARTRLPNTAAIGFYGKIPARGDFIQAGLPRSFIGPWDAWMQRMIAASRFVLGEKWLPAWLEAPVWRFALLPGVCGPGAVIGLYMPSVDCVGRYFPLTLAAVAPETEASALMQGGVGFFAAAEHAGRDALANNLPPEELTARLADAIATWAAENAGDPALGPAHGGLWWTEGAPFVSARRFSSTGLPDENTFVAMLVTCSSMASAVTPEQAR